MSTLATRPVDTTKSALWRNESFVRSIMAIWCARRRGDAARALTRRFPALASSPVRARLSPALILLLRTGKVGLFPLPLADSSGPNPKSFIRPQSIHRHEPLHPPSWSSKQIRAGQGKCAAAALDARFASAAAAPSAPLMDRLLPLVNPSPMQQQHLQHLQVLKPQVFLLGGQVHLGKHSARFLCFSKHLPCGRSHGSQHGAAPLCTSLQSTNDCST